MFTSRNSSQLLMYKSFTKTKLTVIVLLMVKYCGSFWARSVMEPVDCFSLCKRSSRPISWTSGMAHISALISSFIACSGMSPSRTKLRTLAVWIRLLSQSQFSQLTTISRTCKPIQIISDISANFAFQLSC